MFTETACAFPHLDVSDTLLLASYAQASAMSMKLAKGPDTAAWERAVRTQLALARSLRLTHQSRTDPQRIGRRMADRPLGPAPWADAIHQNEGSEDEEE